MFGIKTAKGDKYSPDEEELDDMDDFGETLTEFIEQYLAGKLEVSKVFVVFALVSSSSEVSFIRVRKETN